MDWPIDRRLAKVGDLARSLLQCAAVRTQDQRGFTLIEVMIVVAIVAVLAAIAVYAFGNESAKVKAESEVSPVFAEIHVRQEQYKLENGSYLSLGTWPTTPRAAGQPFNASGKPTEWDDIKFAVPFSDVKCIYTAVAGDGGDTFTPPSGMPTTLSFAPPATRSWYVLIARCDMDRNTTRDSWYLSSSADTKVQRANHGK